MTTSPVRTAAANELAAKIEARKARYGVLGLGYVGLPLAVAFAQDGVEVGGFEVDATKVTELNAGRSYIDDVTSEDLAAVVKSGHLRATTDMGELADCDIISICVPTPLSKSRDPDLAVGQVMRTVQDWSGGTRITDSLREFNRRWARRTLPGQATLLLVTDGLEHGDTSALSFEMERLHKSCRRLVWLNPLLRFDRFEPRAGGVKAMLPHVDRFLPVHNLASLEQLAEVLSGPAAAR